MKPRVGFIGMGKLGLPVALAIDSYGFDVCGTDINPNVKNYLINREIPYKEELADGLLKFHKIVWFNDIDYVIKNSEVIFMPIQTPHEERYEGTTRLPPERKDFDYSFLIQAVKDFANALSLSSDPSPKTLVIISTVLPGTLRREIIPIIEKDKRINLVYNPFFIAMGTTIYDFLNPEFVLLGMDQLRIPVQLLKVYEKIYAGEKFRPQSDFYQTMSIESAELTKVAYNTFITSKICIVNTLMEICHKIPGANIDDVTGALKNASKRIVSPMYMNGGMGDGGGCHPRDNIAMSWLADKVCLSYDWFEHLMISREKQAEFFADLVMTEYQEGDKVFILGYEFKPETELTTGSHALLVYNILYDDMLGDDLILLQSSGSEEYQFEWPKKGKHIIFIGCKQLKFSKFVFHSGTVVIDPFRFIQNQPGVKVIRVGE
jgi:UDPglucose 6-dehydrogenase